MANPEAAPSNGYETVLQLLVNKNAEVITGTTVTRWSSKQLSNSIGSIGSRLLANGRPKIAADQLELIGILEMRCQSAH